MSVEIEQLENETIRVRAGGKVCVVAAACPHRKGRLAYGAVSERTMRISCPLHHSTFDLTTGEQFSGPSSDPLTIYSVTDCVPEPGSKP